MSAISLLRRGSSAAQGRRRGEIPLDLFDTSKGSFTRSTEGFNIISAPTDGSVAMAEWSAAHVRRITYAPSLPGGTGLLIEGGTTQTRYSTFDNWGVSGTTKTQLAAAAPEGTVNAAQVDFTASATAKIETTTGWTHASANYSVYARVASGTQTFRLGVLLQDGTTETISSDFTATTLWQRFDFQVASVAGGSAPVMRVYNGSDGAARTVYFSHYSLDTVSARYYPTSPIRTTTGTSSRGGDILLYTPAEVPASFYTTGFTFQFAPMFSSSEVAGSVTQLLVGNNTAAAGSYIGLLLGTGTVTVRLVRDGTVRTTSLITFSRNQVLTFEVIPNLDRYTVTGATTGDGTQTGVGGSTWNAAFGLAVGALSSAGALPAYGVYGQYITRL